MMSEGIIYSDEDRFNAWISKLEDIIKKFYDDQQDQESRINVQKLSDVIRESIKQEEENIPSLIKCSKNQDNIIRLIRTSDDFKYLLRHIATPNVLKSFANFKSNFQLQDENLSKEYTSSFIPKFPTMDEVSIFFKSILSKKDDKDPLLGFCMLGDIYHRLQRASDRDEAQIKLRLAVESNRLENTSNLLKLQEERFNNLIPNDDNALVTKLLQNIDDELNLQTQLLKEAEEEEANAKKLYLAAIERKNNVQESLSSISVLRDQASQQSKLLHQVTSEQLGITLYNKNSANFRISIFSTFNILLEKLRTVYTDESKLIGKDIVELGNYLSKHFYSNLEKTNESSLFQIRIGFEMIRVWKQFEKRAIRSSLPQGVSVILKEFEDELIKLYHEISNSLQNKSIDDKMFKESENLNSATIVLYYDHIVHNTPKFHNENVLRVETSLKSLKNQEAFTNNIESMRKLKMINCNDIISPPTWCLPLVHAPHYLDQLWRFADEAKEFDLLVPLEFDTEWESLDESDESDNEDCGFHQLQTNLRFPKSFESSYGKNMESIFKPLKGDKSVASELFSQDILKFEVKSDVHEIFRRKGKFVSKKMNNITSSTSQETKAIAHKRSKLDTFIDHQDDTETITLRVLSVPPISKLLKVTTPFGPGVVDTELVNQLLRSDSIIPVTFSWGATGYLHENDVILSKEMKLENISIDAFREVIYSDFSSIASEDVSNASNLQPCPNKILIEIFKQLSVIAGSQRAVTDYLINDRPKISLWLRGRASKLMQQSVENEIKVWIYRVDKEEILKRKELGTNEALIQLLDPIIESERSCEVQSISSFFKDVRVTRAVAKESKPEIDSSNKQRASTSRKGRFDSYAYDDFSDASESELKKNKSKPPKSKATVDSNLASGEKRLRAVSGPHLIPVNTPPEEVYLRKILKKTMDKALVSQAGISKFFNEQSGSDFYDQHKISSWFRYKQRLNLTSIMRDFTIAWLNKYTKHIDPSDVEVISLIKTCDELKESENPDYTSRYEELKKLLEDKIEIKRDDANFISQDDNLSNYLPIDTTSEEMLLMKKLRITSLFDFYKQFRNEMSRRKLDIHQVVNEMKANVKYSDFDSNVVMLFYSNNGQVAKSNSSIISFILKWLHSSYSSKYPSKLIGNSLVDLKDKKIGICSSCGVSIESFDSIGSFNTHIAKCVRQNINNKRPIDNFEASSSSQPLKVAKPNNTSNSYDEPEFNSKNIVVADKFLENAHYFCCEVCKKMDINLRCIFCPNVYHRGCLSDVSSEPITSQSENVNMTESDLTWCCPKCRDCNIQDSILLKKETVVNSPLELVNCWLLLYSTYLHRWRSAIVVKSSPKRGVYLLRYYKMTSKKLSRNYWIDISATKVYLMKTPPEVIVESVIEEKNQLSDQDASKVHELTTSDTNQEVSQMESHVTIDSNLLPSNDDSTVTVPMEIEEENQSINKSEILSESVKVDTSTTLNLEPFVSDTKSISEIPLVAPNPSTGNDDPMETEDTIIETQTETKQICKTEEYLAHINKPSTNESTIFSPSKEDISKFANRSLDFSISKNQDSRDAESNHSTVKVKQDYLNDEDNSEEDKVNMSDTYISSNSLQAALCTAGIACKAVDIVMSTKNTNVFACTRPPGHHAGRFGCTEGCLSTGFCLLNNAAIATVYARVAWGLDRVAVVDIDVHFGNGTAELLRGDPKAFFASVHMVYGYNERSNASEDMKFYPEPLGSTEIEDNYVSIGVKPLPRKGHNNTKDNSYFGPQGYRSALKDVIIPKLEAFHPQLLIISAGFDGFNTDPVGGELNLTIDDYVWSTNQLVSAMVRICGDEHSAKVISLLEGGYDVDENTLGLANCVNSHVLTLRK